MDKKKLYLEKMQSQLKEWDAKIDVLKAKAERAEADLKIKYQKQIDGLQAKRITAQNKLKELFEAGDEAWEKIKDTLEDTWDDVRSFFKKVFPEEAKTPIKKKIKGKKKKKSSTAKKKKKK